jgi:hypothetical protein
MKRIIYLLLFSLISVQSYASHAMGGELTYVCVGGNSFVFQLVFYRDCNGADVNTVSENLRVWNHPTVTSINLPYVSREDVSPICTAVPGYASQLQCGSGSAGGNGVGAIERVIYRSSPIVLNGVPPIDGWIFTYENFSRSNALTNISNPSTYGITLTAKMYAIPGETGTGCSDSSPQFLQEPYFVSCTGSPYKYNMNAVDPDLDSVHFDFGIPFNHFPTLTYNPPISPNPIPFEPGFSYQNPTPDASLNPSNIPSSINPLTGEITFTSFNSGNYLMKVIVRSFRQGVLISEVEREMQIVVMPCSSSNNPPSITPPFSGSFSTTVNAGDLLTFNLNAVDGELLQDGVTPQSLYLTASGPMFGAGLTSTSGCDIEPCATLNSTAPIIGTQQVSATFSWQTTCDHLVNQYGIVADMIPYNFVFKVQDDYCPVPKVSYVTITIFVVNPGIIPPTQINCIKTEDNGDLTINWNVVNNPSNSFVEYQLHSVEDGMIGTPILDINTTQVTIPPVNSIKHYFVTVRSGCNGNVLKNSDTLSNIFLDLINPINGTAILQWNRPRTVPLSNYNSYFHIYREYPAGIFTLIDSTLYNSTYYKDTIDICQAFLSYKIVLPTSSCYFSSNKPGDDFEDMITPDIPLIYGVGADTTQFGNVLINWNQNGQPDTYGYVIYTFDADGVLYELDTIWGQNNTSYSYSENLSNGPFSYSVAAFDSCYTTSTPVTYQTSAKAYINQTMVLSSNIQMCEKQVDLFWTPYVGRQVMVYYIWKKQNGTWENISSTTDTSITLNVVNGENYCFYVEARFNDNRGAFSSPSCFLVPSPGIPSYHYFELATINDGKVILNDYIDASVGIQAIQFERRKAVSGAFEIIANLPVNGDITTYIDESAEVENYSMEYRTKYIDSCGGFANNYANINRTIHLSGVADEYELINTIKWNRYEGFNAGVHHYNVYRSLNGTFTDPPIASITNTDDNQEIYSFTDNIDNLVSNTQANSIQDYANGAMCYRIVAVENDGNIYGFQDSSQSNDLCLNYQPLAFIPNSFTPEGNNPIFIPVITNVSEKNYSFEIMNRWGNVFFRTDDILEGWDGIVLSSGEKAGNDTYLYFIQFEDQDGVTHKKRGVVSLIR